ncbi:hypothetical protein [Psychroflexus tropicus]|uniref:hypothetical protein n=1 Tax=Psychroflexus tropicus TaxID=197345 RepID=UPI000367AE42|nr:hypothetical protein [Psychroflexus tropicus]
MKKVVLSTLLLILLSQECKSQHFDVGFGVGSGAAYLVEANDNAVDISYALPFSSYLDLKFTPAESYFGLKLRFQYLNAGIEGENWKNFNQPIDGDVSSLTTLLMLEHLKDNQTWNLGYNFGVGYTYQSFRPDLTNLTPALESRFMSFLFSGLLSRTINDQLAIQLEPGLLWTDPVGSFRSSEKWQIAGEDLSVLLQAGVRYKLF